MAAPGVLTLKDGRQVEVTWNKPNPPTPEEVDQLAMDAEDAFGGGAKPQTPDAPQKNWYGDVKMNVDEVARAAHRAGFRGEGLTNAVAIALAESGGNPRAANRTAPDDSHGLWQVNYFGNLKGGRTKKFGPPEAQYDPDTNAKAAYQISGAGRNFRPWTTFTSGKHKQYLSVAQEAANRLEQASVGATAGLGTGVRPAPKGQPGKDRPLIDLSGGKPSLDFKSDYEAAKSFKPKLKPTPHDVGMEARFAAELPFTMKSFQFAIDNGYTMVPTKTGGTMSIKNAMGRVTKITGQTEFRASAPPDVIEQQQTERDLATEHLGSAPSMDFGSRLKENYKNLTGIDPEADAPYAGAALDILGGILGTPNILANTAVDVAKDPIRALQKLPELGVEMLNSVNAFEPNISGPERFKRVINGIFVVAGVKQGIGALKTFAESPEFAATIGRLKVPKAQALKIMDEVASAEAPGMASFVPKDLPGYEGGAAPDLKAGLKPLTKSSEPPVPEKQTKAATEQVPPSLPAEPQHPTRTVTLKPSEIKVHPDIQFRSNITDPKAKVTSRYKGVKVYDVDQGGDLLVWQDKAGQRFVVNGHHRLEIANRAEKFISTREAAGKLVEVPRELEARVLREIDGWTLKQARAQGALENIRDGNATALDAIRVIRDLDLTMADLEARGTSFKTKLGKEIEGLSGLSDDALEPVFAGQVPEEVAAGIGSVKLSPEEQAAIMRNPQLGTLRSFEEGASLAEKVRQRGLVRKVKDSQVRMFEDDKEFQDGVTTSVEESKIESAIRSAIGRERQDLLKIPSELLSDESINAEARKQLAADYGESAKGVKDAVTFVLERDQDLNTRLGEWAKKVVNGEATVEQAANDLIGGTREALRGGLGRYAKQGLGPAVRTQGAEPAGESPNPKATGDRGAGGLPIETPQGTDWGRLGQTLIDEAQARITERKSQGTGKGGKRPGGKRSGAVNVGPEDFKKAFADAADEVVIAAGYLMKHGGHFASAIVHLAADQKMNVKAARQFIQEANTRLKSVGYVSPVEDVTKLLATAGPANKEQVKLNAEIRSRQAAQLQDVRGTGEAGLKKGLGILKGQFPKVTINPIGDKLSQLSRDQLLNIIDARDDLSPQAQVGLKQDLMKMLDFGEVPTRYSIDWFRKIYGQDFVSALLKNRDAWAKTKDLLGDLVFGVMRMLTATLDDSATLIHGGKAFFTDNKAWRDAFGKSIEAFANEDVSNLINHEIKTDPQTRIGMKHGLDILESDVGDIKHGEELFVGGPISRWIESLKVPGTDFAPIKASNDAFATFGNVIRSYKFKQGLHLLERANAADDHQLNFLADLTNKWSGRGNLGKGIASRAGNFLAQVAYSPKYNLALFQYPITSIKGVLDPSLPPALRKQIAKDMAKWLVYTAGVLELGQKRENEVNGEKREWGIWDVNTDPNSTDFLKGKIGNTRVDLTGGYASLLSTMWVLSPFTEHRTTLAGNEKEFSSEGPYAETKAEYAIRFLRKKLAPAPGLAYDILDGKTVTGEDVTLEGEAQERLIPFWIQDMKDAIQDQVEAEGWGFEPAAKGVGQGVLGFFGLRLTTIPPKGGRRSLKRQARRRD